MVVTHQLRLGEIRRRTAAEVGTSYCEDAAHRRNERKGAKMFGRRTTPAGHFLIY